MDNCKEGEGIKICFSLLQNIFQPSIFNSFFHFQNKVELKFTGTPV